MKLRFIGDETKRVVEFPPNNDFVLQALQNMNLASPSKYSDKNTADPSAQTLTLYLATSMGSCELWHIFLNETDNTWKALYNAVYQSMVETRQALNDPEIERYYSQNPMMPLSHDEGDNFNGNT